MEHGIRLSTVNLNAPDPSALGAFYARLLGWEVKVDEPGWVVVAGEEYVALSFEEDVHFQPPVWPSEPGLAPIQMHLDVRVTDLEGAVRHAEGVRCEAAPAPAPGRRAGDGRPRRPRVLPLARRPARRWRDSTGLVLRVHRVTHASSGRSHHVAGGQGGPHGIAQRPAGGRHTGRARAGAARP